MSSSLNIVITGANRGIGLSLCQLSAAKGARVFAVCRTASNALGALVKTYQDKVTLLSGCDVTQPETLEPIKQAIASTPLHLIINNAGVLQNEALGSLDFSSIEEQFKVNALGPLRISELLLPNMISGAKIAMISSRMGSINDNTSGGRYGYRMSKAALNIASVSLAHDLKSRAIAVGLFHPGLVGTDMIGGHGDISPDEAAERLLQRIDELSLKNSGQFWHANGDQLPW